ncbi:MAG: sensor histidine kinase [Candidatus Limnocylindria bacterium]
MDALRRDVRRLRQQTERFDKSYQRRAEIPARRGGDRHRPGEPDDVTRRAYRRLKQLQLVAQHLESSTAYLLGSGLEPDETERDERVEVAQRVLESLEAERARLYRDVHDGPAQVLANAIFEMEYLERIAERAPTDVRQSLRTELANLKAQFRSSLDAVRAMIYDLRPPELSQVGLAEALRNYAGEFEARYGLGIACSLAQDETGVGPQQELAVYRVMQEALQNVHKHANATAVRIAWERVTPAGWALHVADDGVGFDLVKVARRPKSVGLLSMRERAELIGGSLQIQSAPGQGTTVTLLVPQDKEGKSRGR